MNEPLNPGYGFGSMPPEAAPAGQERGAQPRTVSLAAQLMWARAGVTATGVVTVLATHAAVRRAVVSSHPDLGTSAVDRMVRAVIGFDVVAGLVIAVAYALLAARVRLGKGWARITTWILAGIGALGAVGAIVQPSSPLSRGVLVVGAILDVAIIVLLARRPSGTYFGRP